LQFQELSGDSWRSLVMILIWLCSWSLAVIGYDLCLFQFIN